MVNVRGKRCSDTTCSRTPSFNVESCKTRAYCKQHATNDMINVRDKRWSHDTCSKLPCFNIAGSKERIYCMQHAEAGMVNVNQRKRCSEDACKKRPSWGLLAGGAATACAGHEEKIVDGPAVNFKAECAEAGCRAYSTWGYGGQQPSHCREHGPMKDGLVYSVRIDSSKCIPRVASYAALQVASFQVKAECQF